MNNHDNTPCFSLQYILTHILILKTKSNLVLLLSILNRKKIIPQPQISQDYPVNLSILITGGKETNKDVCSIGE
jgi:hypothetical protein